MLKSFRAPFTATPLQVATYLIGVAVSSISFLVFVNSTISFVITDLVGAREGIGDAVGTLGFADELVALVACPFWGLVSDRLGVRLVCVIGYAIVGFSLLAITQARNVYPHLLLARLLFSIGGSAAATMVTAILPTMTLREAISHGSERYGDSGHGASHAQRSPTSSVITVTQARMQSSDQSKKNRKTSKRAETSTVSGIVGMSTGIGALFALGVFLPLPARFQAAGYNPLRAIQNSFASVACVAFAVSIFCGFGLRGLPGERQKGWSTLLRGTKVAHDHSYDASPHVTSSHSQSTQNKANSYLHLGLQSIRLGFSDVAIGLGYLGGFVARASSVGISLFIPLFVNAYFISEGLCKGNGPASNPNDVKAQCSRAYKLAAILTGVSQLVALLCAPLFGWLDGRYRRFNLPLLFAAAAGIIGYLVLTLQRSPELGGKHGGDPSVLLLMGLIGISQIGAIVCSLSLIGRGVQSPSASFGTESRLGERQAEAQTDADTEGADERSSLLRPQQSAQSANEVSAHPDQEATRNHLKGSIAGMYSLSGGAGILLLTKLGGFLFDRVSIGAPFYMLAAFNTILLVVGLTCLVWREVRTARRHVVNALDVPE